MDTRRGIALWATAAILCVAFGGVAGPAAADPPPNESSEYALNLPSSVLTDAAPTGLSGALLAAGQRFNWAFAEAQFAAVSGTLTSTPIAAELALTPAEEAAWVSITKNYAAPATRAAPLLKFAGPVGVAVTGYSVGVMLGHGLLQFTGFDADDAVCSTSGAEQVVTSVLSGADCTGWNSMLEEFVANADVSQNVVGGASCDSFGCMTMTEDHSFNLSGPFGSTHPTQLNSFRVWCLDLSYYEYGYSIHYLRANGTRGAVPVQSWPPPRWSFLSHVMNCGTGNSYIMFSDSNPASTGVFPPIPAAPGPWVYHIGGMNSAQILDCLQGNGVCAGGALSVPVITTPDVERTLECAITGSDFTVYTATSATFTEGSGFTPAVNCPALPEGVGFESMSITENGNGEAHEWWSEDATDAYSAWLANYPECTNGSCLVDLRRNDVSCFVGDTPCMGWFTDPARDSTYDCKYGTHSVPLTECYVYANVFSTDLLESGHAYADPDTGTGIEEQTSPTSLDSVTKSLFERLRASKGWINAPTGQQTATVLAVAAQCLAFDTESNCKRRAIYAPGSEVEQVAQHNLEAILSGGQPHALTYLSRSDKIDDGFNPQWYTGVVSDCDVPRPPDEACDEYPYFSSEEGAHTVMDPATQELYPSGSLRYVNGVQNSSEGGRRGQFASLCKLNSYPRNSDARVYLVVPTVVLPTAYWCANPWQ